MTTTKPELNLVHLFRPVCGGEWQYFTAHDELRDISITRWWYVCFPTDWSADEVRLMYDVWMDDEGTCWWFEAVMGQNPNTNWWTFCTVKKLLPYDNLCVQCGGRF